MVLMLLVVGFVIVWQCDSGERGAKSEGNKTMNIRFYHCATSATSFCYSIRALSSNY